MYRLFNVIFLSLSLLLFSCSSTGKKNAELQIEITAPQTEMKLSEYVLGVGDTVEISVYRNDDLKTLTKINTSGKIIFPLIGEVPVAGKNIPELREDLRNRLSKYLVEPQVIVSISAVQSQKVYILGEVKSPGLVALDTNLSILDAVMKVGGWTQDANLENIILLRNASGKVNAQAFDMNSVLKGGNISNNKLLRTNDIIYVPTKKIADLARFMSYIASILSPVIMTESGIVLAPQMIDALQGKTPSTGINISGQ